MIKIIHCGYLGTETPYIYQKTKYTLPPLGYSPFFINHVGRHGARYLTSVDPIIALIKQLNEAEALGKLKVEGEILKKQLQKLLPVEAEEEGLLTPSGIEMEKGIANRMAFHYPEVFGKKVIAVSTYVQRTKESMEAFLEQLARWAPESEFEASSNGRIDPILRFFDLNTLYLDYKAHGKWKEMVSVFEKRQDVLPGILCNFFELDFIKKMKDPMQFINDLYQVYRNQFDTEENVGLGIYFTDDLLCYLWENENLRQYLEKGPSYVGQCLPTNIAFALLMDFLSTSEEAIKKRQLSAYLRFAHAETLIPFTGLLRLLGFFNQTSTLNYVSTIWQDYCVAPMAANLQWIFYENPREEVILVKMLYNESEVRLPIRSVCGPYYDFRAVRTFYIQALQALKLDWKKDLVEMVRDYTGTSCYSK